MTVTEFISSLVESNAGVGAGLGLATIGALAAASRKGLQALSVFGQRYLSTSLEVQSKDKSYEWMLLWVGERARSTQHISVLTDYTQLESGAVQANHHFVPSTGVHVFWYRGYPVWVERSRQNQAMAIFETLTFKTMGRNKAIFEEALCEAKELSQLATEGKTITYLPFGAEWRKFGEPKRKRPLSSVVLDEKVFSRLTDDVTEFCSSQQWYVERGVPYRRGYLLHGPPGTGKTSFITAVAGAMNLGIAVLNLGDPGLSDDRLQYLMATAPPQTLTLLEDVDSAGATRRDGAAYEGLKGLTLSGLLNALDGVVASEGRLVFMTTNHPLRLDPAILRPGRCDVKEELGNCSDYQVEQMFARFYPEVCEEAAQGALGGELSVSGTLGHKPSTSGTLGHKPSASGTLGHKPSATGTLGHKPSASGTLGHELSSLLREAGQQVSPAQLQAHFLRHRHSATEAVRSFQEIALS